MPQGVNYLGLHRGNGDESVGVVAEFLVGGELTASFPRQLHIAQSSDADTDWGIADQAHPLLSIHSVTTPITDHLDFQHDGTSGIISAVGGSLSFTGVGEVVFNEASADVDFRIESNADANMFFLDANLDAIGIGTATPSTNVMMNFFRNDTSVLAMLRLEQDSTGDATMEFLLTAGAEWTIGVDNSATDTFVISAGGDLGTGDEDAIRITDATPPVATYNATHPTGTFDYVCEKCGEHGSDSFECHGVMAPWHDDVQAMGLALREMSYNLQESPAMRHLADIGVLNMTQDDEGVPWTGINMAAAQWFTWSAMQQMYKRIEVLEAERA